MPGHTTKAPGARRQFEQGLFWVDIAHLRATIDAFATASFVSISHHNKKGRALKEFLTDVKTLREQARKNMDQGPITESYGADVSRVIEVLNQALATELICVLRYQQHHYAAKGLDAEPVAAEFLQHAKEEQAHAERIAGRISQLGGLPDFNPSTLGGRAHSEYRTASGLLEMVEENLVAERIAISSYTEIILWLGTADSTTRRMLEEILAVEEEHANDMSDLLEKTSKST